MDPDQVTRPDLIMRWRPRLRHAPGMIVVALVLGRTVTLALAAFHRADAFLSLWPIDLANINQAIWNTAHGKPYFNTIFYEAMRGHFDPILMLISPVYLFTDSLLGVFLVYSLVISSGAIAVYLLARTVIESETTSVLLALAYLCFTPLVELTVLQIRGDVLAVPFLLFAFLFYRERRFAGFVVFGILALMCKETIAVVMILWGGLAVIQRRELKWILAPIIAGAGVLIFTLFIYHPHIQGYPYKHTSLAKRQTDIGPALILDPTSWRFLLERFFNWGGLIALASPVPLLLATPFVAASFIWPSVVHHPLWFHTFAPAYAFLFASFTLAVTNAEQRFTTHRALKPLVAALLMAGSATMLYEGRELFRSPGLSVDDQAIHALIDQIPADASVAAPPLVLPPLSTRPVLRSIVIKDARGAHIDPLDVDWVLLTRGLLPWSRIITMPKAKVFETTYQETVARLDSTTDFELVDRRGAWELHRRVASGGEVKETRQPLRVRGKS